MDSRNKRASLLNASILSKEPESLASSRSFNIGNNTLKIDTLLPVFGSTTPVLNEGMCGFLAADFSGLDHWVNDCVCIIKKLH